MSTRNETLAEAARTSLDASKVLLASHEATPVEDGQVLALHAVALELHALTLTVEAALLPSEPRADRPPEVKEGWYSIELMGHRSREGYVRPVTCAGRPLIEVREPSHRRGEDGPMKPERVEFYSPAAIYCLSPSTEAEVMHELVAHSGIPF